MDDIINVTFDPTLTSTPVRKKPRKSEVKAESSFDDTVESSGVAEDESLDDVEYWLVRTPKNVDSMYLPKLKIPQGLETEISVTKRNRKGKNMMCRYAPSATAMYVLDPENARVSSKGKKKMKPVAKIAGMLTIVPEEEIQIAAPVEPEEDFLRPENYVSPEPSAFEVQSIRRKPVVYHTSVSQRGHRGH